MHVGALYEYPVKSLSGVSATAVDVEAAGFRRDRRWMVVDAAGEVLTARERNEMLGLTATPDDPEGVVLSAPGRPSLAVPVPRGGPAVPVQLSRLPYATAAGAEAETWLAAAGLRGARLVWLDDPARRPVAPHHGGRPGDPLSLADAGPILLATTASMRQLNTWIDERAVSDGRPLAPPLVIQRFRPNIVVDGDVAAFAEDGWAGVQVGDLRLRFAERCDRCVLTTIDPVTLVRGKEPIRTLAQRRRWDGRVFFGVRLVPEHPGRIRVGDPVSPL